MRRIITDLENWQQQGEEIAVATLVAVHGSSPCFPGARLVVTRSGKMAGSVSGGCVENDVFMQSMQVLDQRRPLLARYGISGEAALDVGLSCGGKIDVLLDRFHRDEAWSLLSASVLARRPVAAALALAPEALIGRRLSVDTGASRAGGIDAALDDTICEQALGLLDRDEHSSVLELPWRGVQARVFVEAVAPPPRLFIVGATHIGISLCRMAKDVGFEVIVVDPRATFASSERFPEADSIECAWPGEVLAAAALDRYSYVVTLSHDPKFDIPTLQCCLDNDTRYIGALGSRRTHARREKALTAEGYDERQLARISAPIGLDLGGRRPEEIAVAILAEILAVRYGRSAQTLAGRKEAIHAAS